jgi:hypothetical protein
MINGFGLNLVLDPEGFGADLSSLIARLLAAEA